MCTTSPYSDPDVSMDLDPQPITDEEEGLIWVVGPVLAVVFIICIVSLFFFIKGRLSPVRLCCRGGLPYASWGLPCFQRLYHPSMVIVVDLGTNISNNHWGEMYPLLLEQNIKTGLIQCV